jgi:hypothetical protein
VPLPSHVTSCTPIESNLYLDSSHKTVVSEPALYKLLIFHVQNLMFIFCCLGRLSRESIQIGGSVNCSVARLLCKVRGCLPHVKPPKLEEQAFSFVCGCLFNILAATLQCWRPSFHPQPEDAPCCGDKGSHITWILRTIRNKIYSVTSFGMRLYRGRWRMYNETGLLCYPSH